MVLHAKYWVYKCQKLLRKRRISRRMTKIVMDMLLMVIVLCLVVLRQLIQLLGVVKAYITISLL